MRTKSLVISVVRILRGTAVAQWLRCCATNRKVAGSIPADVTGVDSASNRNEYQENFLGVKAAGV